MTSSAAAASMHRCLMTTKNIKQIKKQAAMKHPLTILKVFDKQMREQMFQSLRVEMQI